MKMKRISDAELEVLKVIWDKNIVTSLDIIYELRDNNWNSNTVRTLIKRLLEKGAIEIVGKKNKVYYYQASIDKEKFKYLRTQALLINLFDNKIENLIINYLKYEKNKEEKKQIITKLLQHENKKKALQ
ncbi:MAG: BlaI/MecI/CopY family transcriptional regulator [Candidatus Scatovivens sp.]